MLEAGRRQPWVRVLPLQGWSWGSTNKDSLGGDRAGEREERCPTEFTVGSLTAGDAPHPQNLNTEPSALHAAGTQ